MSEGAAPSSGASSGASTSTPSAGSAPASTPSTTSAAPSQSGQQAAPKSPPQSPQSPGAPKPPAQTAAQVAEEKRYKRLINGQPVELSRSEAIETVFGTIGDDEVLDLASLRRASHERMQEAARVRKERDELRAKLAGDGGFKEWLALHGDNREAALRQIEAEMTSEYQRSLMTPEQQELARTKAELERLRGEHQKREEAERAAKRQQQATAFRERFAADVKTQCKSLGLAPTPQVIAAFAAHAEQSLRSRQPVDVAAIARVVQREVDEGWSAFLGGLDDDALDTRLGDRLERIAARRAARLSQATPKPGAPVSAPVRGKPPAQAPRDEGGRFAPQNGGSAPRSLEQAFRALEEQRRR